MTSTPAPLISPLTLAERVRAASHGLGEIAVIDVREQHAYAEHLILLSANLPLHRLELSVATALPRLQTPIVIVDQHGELAEQATQRLRQLGYTDLSVLDGGIQAWQVAGLTLYDGFNVRSKAFAEQIEHDFATPAISATELFARQARGEDILVLDSRPYEEYHHSTVPGALSVPGAELLRSIRDIAPDPRTTVVVSCGGRTRSIVGAQALISAGVPNQVLSLRNGTGGLRLDGIELQYGATRAHAAPSEAALAWAEHAARQWDGQTPTVRLSSEHFQRWQADRQRTLYVLDLREAPSYVAGHHPLARNVSGGQVLQAIDVHAPVWNARIVLIDEPSLVRARQTAYWLGQLGSFEVGIIAQPELPGALVQGALPAPVRHALHAQISVLDVARLATALAGGEPPTVIDLSLSPAYRKAHIPGSRWALRSQLPSLLATLGADRPVVLTCEDGRLSRVAAEYLVAEQPGLATRLCFLEGGNQAWQGVAQPTDSWAVNGPEDVAQFVDVWTPPQQTIGDMLGAVKKYLNWEVNLLEQLARDPLRDVIIRGLRCGQGS